MIVFIESLYTFFEIIFFNDGLVESKSIKLYFIVYCINFQVSINIFVIINLDIFTNSDIPLFSAIINIKTENEIINEPILLNICLVLIPTRFNLGVRVYLSPLNLGISFSKRVVKMSANFVKITMTLEIIMLDKILLSSVTCLNNAKVLVTCVDTLFNNTPSSATDCAALLPRLLRPVIWSTALTCSWSSFSMTLNTLVESLTEFSIESVIVLITLSTSPLIPAPKLPLASKSLNAPPLAALTKSGKTILNRSAVPPCHIASNRVLFCTLLRISDGTTDL